VNVGLTDAVVPLQAQEADPKLDPVLSKCNRNSIRQQIRNHIGCTSSRRQYFRLRHPIPINIPILTSSETSCRRSNATPVDDCGASLGLSVKAASANRSERAPQVRSPSYSHTLRKQPNLFEDGTKALMYYVEMIDWLIQID
jgi:hypothetical protein